MAGAALTLLYVFVLGACFGSFLNVCIYRLPRELSIVKPRSFCPYCSRLIHWYDNIPLVSYFALKGRCRFCARRISFRYVAVEFLTAVLTVLVYQHAAAGGLGPYEIFMRILLTYALIVLSVIDLDFYIIPNEITYSGFVIGTLHSLISPGHIGEDSAWTGLFTAMHGAIIGGGSLWLVGWMAKLLMKKEAMGMGDVKLMAMAGAWLGWKGAVGSIMLASIIGSIVGLALVSLKRLRLESRVPFGPFLALGIFVFMMWGDALVAWYVEFVKGAQG